MIRTQVLVEVCRCESVPSEQQTRVPVEPVVSDGWGGTAGEQSPIKLFQFVCQIAQEKMVREGCLPLVAQEFAGWPE